MSCRELVRVVGDVGIDRASRSGGHVGQRREGVLLVLPVGIIVGAPAIDQVEPVARHPTTPIDGGDGRGAAKIMRTTPGTLATPRSGRGASHGLPGSSPSACGSWTSS